MPAVVEIIREADIDVKIVASMICGVDSPQTAAYYESLGVSRIVLDRDISRDFTTIKRIRSVFNGDIELIVNSTCLKGCPFKSSHYNSIAHDGNRSVDSLSYYRSRCHTMKKNDPLHIMKMNWIRPEDIHLYTKSGVSYFKLAGRESILQKNPVMAAECYLKEQYNGDLQSLLDLFQHEKRYKRYLDNNSLNGFLHAIWENSSECSGVCKYCSHCSDYASRALTEGVSL